MCHKTFTKLTNFYHLNIRLVRYSDRDCILTQSNFKNKNFEFFVPNEMSSYYFLKKGSAETYRLKGSEKSVL